MTNSGKALTFAAIFISCLALVVSIMQTRILQKQSLASVWPRLSKGQGVGPDYYICSLTNDGVGPAIVKDVKYTFKDTSFQFINDMIYHFGRMEKEASGKSFRLNFQFSNISPGSVIADDKKIVLYEAADSLNVELAKKYFEESTMKITYCSIYDDCWVLDEYETHDID